MRNIYYIYPKKFYKNENGLVLFRITEMHIAMPYIPFKKYLIERPFNRKPGQGLVNISVHFLSGLTACKDKLQDSLKLAALRISYFPYTNHTHQQFSYRAAQGGKEH